MAPLRPSPLAMLLGAIFFFSTNVFAVVSVLGLDLGTEYIKAALVKPGTPLEIVLTKDSRRKETSAVAFKPLSGGPKAGQFPERAYGADAMAIAARFPGDVYPNLKPLLGLPLGDALVQEYASRHPAMQVQSHPGRGTAAFKTNTLLPEEEAWLVEELLAMELQSIQKNAEATAGDGSSVRSVVLNVPPFYTTEEKRAVQMAAELAGLKVLSLLSDGMAVGLNYAVSRQFPNINEGAKPEYHLVFDMGAGSTTATIMRFQSRNVKDVGKFNKTVQEVQVLGTGWDRTLGGDALNSLIVDDMVSQFVESKGALKIAATSEGLKSHGRAMAKLSKEAERLRHVLSANQNTQGSFEGLYEDVDFKYKITRAAFEDLAAAHVERLGSVLSNALAMAGLDIGDINSVILHGGASRTPFVQKALEKFVGSADKVRTNVNSDEAAVFGAGFRAAELSPGFRVKEIRILEGAGYQAGLKWTNGNDKAQRQRLWTPGSPLGAAAKEVTFNEKEDFSATVYQQIGSEDQDIKVLSTKNLTATVAAMKEKYPSCDESDIRFKLAVKLSSENGEVEVSNAFIECEAEVPEKEGFVDGVKNFLGFGKKDQQPLKDGETAEDADVFEGSEEIMKEPSEPSAASTSSESATTSAATGADAESTEESKSGAKKREIVSIPVKMETEKTGIPQLTKDELTKSKDRLKAFAASDRARLQREEALNQLEGYTYRVRDKLEDEHFIIRSTESERTKIGEKSKAVSEWLYDEGSSATKEELKAKLKELQDLVSPVQQRLDESEKRPEVLASLKDALNTTESFLETIRKQIDEYEEWHASASADGRPAEETARGDFDDLEDLDADSSSDKESSMEGVLKERGPVPPLYQREDMDEVQAVYESTVEWLKKIEPRQQALGVTDNPVLLVKDLTAKREKLDKAGTDLAMKGVKNFERKSKQATKSAASKKKSKTSSADPAGHTIKLDGDNPMSQEDIEELLKKINLEDLKKDQETKKSGGAKSEHDEL